MDMFGKLSWFFKQERKSYFIGIMMLVGVAILTGLVPLILGWIIDSMTAGTITMNALWKWVILLVIIAIAQYAMRNLWRISIFGTSAKLEQILRSRLFKHFTQMDSEFYQQYRTGDLMARTTNDLNAVRMVAGGGILTLVDSMSQGLITLFMMFFVVDWRLTLVSIIPFPLLAIAIRIIGRKLHYHSRQSQDAFSAMNDKVQESVTGMKVIKTFGEEELDIQDFERMTSNVVDKNRELYKFDAAFMPTSQLIMGLSTMIGLFFGGYLVVTGDITIGLLVAFISYITRLNWPMIAIGRLFNILERGSASYDRVMEILGEVSHITERDNPIEKSIAGLLEVKLDSFMYHNGSSPVLEDIYFKLEQGQTLGIVGKTGSGKTSLFKLLMRDYDHYRGQILYNHVNIKDYSLASLLTQIGYVPQDNFLFSTTVRENIRFGRPDATQEEVEEVAKAASVHEDILGFPDGYDTEVGEQGVTLSGGQRQRIAIARALLMNPELLILDDSLSAVDAKTEESILEAIKQSSKNKSTIISAHRLSSVMHAEEILVFENGRIAERGTHQELIELNGWYAEMYQKQQLEQAEGEVMMDV